MRLHLALFVANEVLYYIGGQTEVERTLVARYISVNERKRVMRHMSIAVALGYIAGPGKCYI